MPCSWAENFHQWQRQMVEKKGGIARSPNGRKGAAWKSTMKTVFYRIGTKEVFSVKWERKVLWDGRGRPDERLGGGPDFAKGKKETSFAVLRRWRLRKKGTCLRAKGRDLV